MAEPSPNGHRLDPAAAWEGVAAALLVFSTAYLAAALVAPLCVDEDRIDPGDGQYRSAFVLVAGATGIAGVAALSAFDPRIRSGLTAIRGAPRSWMWSLPVHLVLLALYQFAVCCVRHWIVGSPVDPALARLLETAASPLLPLLAVGVIGPLYEELLWRGVVHSALLRVRGAATVAVPVTAALFALSHLGYPPLQLCYLFLFGAYLGVVRQAAGSVGTAAGLHIAWNLLLFVPSLVY